MLCGAPAVWTQQLLRIWQAAPNWKVVSVCVSQRGGKEKRSYAPPAALDDDNLDDDHGEDEDDDDDNCDGDDDCNCSGSDGGDGSGIDDNIGNTLARELNNLNTYSPSLYHNNKNDCNGDDCMTNDLKRLNHWASIRYKYR